MEQTHTDTGKLNLIAYKSFSAYNDMYKVIDFLNKNLKDKGVMFGLTKTENKAGENAGNDLTVSIYEF